MILVDTSVLSLAFRRRVKVSPEPPMVQILHRLIERDQLVAVPGIVLQELLSGVRTYAEFERLQDLMEGFPLIPAMREHHVGAAMVANICRQAGITVSTVGCLIAAMTIETKSQLLTSDEDLKRMASCCALQLFKEAG